MELTKTFVIMKELSIEEKAKRYELALERCRKLYNEAKANEYNSDIEDYETIFPELRESEGERIRKEIEQLIRDMKVCDQRRERWLAWLEKQGEPTEIDPSEFDLRLNKLLKQFESLPKEELITNLSYYLNVIQNDGTYKIEKQGEQKHSIDINKMVDDYANNKERGNAEFGKPVPCMIRAYRQGLNDAIHQKDFAPKEVIPRYSIGDVLCDKSCTTLSKEEQPNFEITDIRNGMYICDKCSFPISQQDEYELVAKRIEQKPWSEEDESILSDIVNHFDGFPLKHQTHEIFGWLVSLKHRIGG